MNYEENYHCKPDSELRKTPTARDSVDAPVRLLNAITEALREMEKCPDDSVQDIWNESLESWETGLRMNHLLESTPEAPRKHPGSLSRTMNQ